MVGSETTARVIAAAVAAVLATNGVSHAQSTGPAASRLLPGPIVLVDSTGKPAARPLNGTIMLVSLDKCDARAYLAPAGACAMADCLTS